VDFPRAPVSPLGTAISYNCSDAVPLLIAARADVNYVGPKLLSPLGTAAFHHDLDAAALLLDARADPDLHGPSGQPAPPLESAALTGSVAMVRLLLARGADPSLRAPGFVPPLQLAARGDALFPTRGETFDHPNFVRLRGLPRDPLGVLKALLEAKADVAARDPAGGCTALIVATGEGFAPGVEALIAAGADVKGAEGAAALSFAAERGRAGCVRALLAAGVPADTVAGDGRTPLTVAVMRDDAEVARALIAARADVNRAHKGVSLLELSAAGGGAVSAALRHAGARSLFHQLLQRSALMRALCSGDREGAMRLVPSSSAEELEAALLHAAHHADEAMVTATLRAGAGPSCVSGGVTPLLAASRRGHAGVVRVLLERRADVGARPGVSGQTALQGAAAGRHREVVALLLARSNEVKREQTRGGK
jgi:ankyrin repeat protein